VIQLMSHERLLRLLKAPEARAVYADVEAIPVVSNDYHYWLQRGSVEVEAGDLRLAENFLNQARSLVPSGEDYRVETEYAYMLIRKAVGNPAGGHSIEFIEKA